MENEAVIAHGLLRNVIFFIEHGDVIKIDENEATNYFQMCKQIEIYFRKFREKGFFMCYDLSTDVFSLNTSVVSVAKYDIEHLADSLMGKFWCLSTYNDLMAKAIHLYLTDFGKKRFSAVVRQLGGLNRIFNEESILIKSSDPTFDLEAAYIMRGIRRLRSSPNFQARVDNYLTGLIVEDMCAVTVVAMFAVEDDIDPIGAMEIKKQLLHKLQEKYTNEPHSELWIRVLSSLTLVEGVIAYPPLLPFILDMIKDLSKSITYVEKTDEFVSTGRLTYPSLLQIVTALYRNTSSSQTVINFVFHQSAVNPSLWSNVLQGCHNLPPIEPEPSPYDFTLPPSLEWKK